MNWLLLMVYATYSGGVTSGTFITTGNNMYLQSIHATREECRTALEAKAKDSGATEIILVCVEGEVFKPVPRRELPKEKRP